jgi:hypothetical protein
MTGMMTVLSKSNKSVESAQELRTVGNRRKQSASGLATKSVRREIER